MENKYEEMLKNLKIKGVFMNLDHIIPIVEELVKRSTPTKVIGPSISHEGRCGNCPSCNKLVHEQTKDAYNRPLHVCPCGQLIDWSDTK